MSLRRLIKQGNGLGNAAALGWFQGQLYGTICIWLICFSVLGVFILGTSWKWVGLSIGLTIGLVLVMILQAIWAWIKLLFFYFFQMGKR
jgi:hypothetical protein